MLRLLIVHSLRVIRSYGGQLSNLSTRIEWIREDRSSSVGITGGFTPCQRRRVCVCISVCRNCR